MKSFAMVAGLSLLLASTACGSKTETAALPGGGSVATSQDGGQTEITVTAPGGQTAHIETNADGSARVEVEEGADGATTDVKMESSAQIDPSHFSVPFYPGAQVVGGGVTETTSGEQTLKMAGATLKTSDPVDKVAEFYGGEMEGATRISSETEGVKTVVFAPKDPARGTSVTITTVDGSTQVSLTSQGL